MSERRSVPGFSVVPTSLHGGSRSLATAADHIRSTATTHLPTALAGAQAHPNLQTSQALGRIHAAWTSHLTAHADRLDGHSQNLHTCAAEYVRIDNGVYDHLARIRPKRPTAEV